MAPDMSLTLLKPDATSTATRVLGVIDLFTEDEPVWTADRIIERLQASRATVYRYLQALTAAGFLSQLARGAYSLGPRIIELDRQIRIADPLLRVAPPVMAAQRDAVAGTQLLFRYYGLRVFSIFEERSAERVRTSFDRGRPFSLFRGSGSRIILANLPAPQLRRLFLHHAGEIMAAGLGSSWPEFRDTLKAIRKRGVAVASDIDTALIGIAAPIFAGPQIVSGSLVCARIRSEVSDRDIAYLSDLAIEATKLISERLEEASV
jgi:DNA-binding IclR family transcriptional regulator